MQRTIKICGGFYCGKNWDAPHMRQALRAELAEHGLESEVEVPELVGGCFGLCLRGPNLIIEPDEVWYAKVKEADLAEIVRSHLIGGQVVKRLQDPMHLIWKHRRTQAAAGV